MIKRRHQLKKTSHHFAFAVELFGIEYITDAMGISQMCQGVAAILGPPIGGWLYQTTGSYRATFAMSGFAMAFSAMMEGSLPAMASWENAKKNK